MGKNKKQKKGQSKAKNDKVKNPNNALPKSKRAKKRSMGRHIIPLPLIFRLFSVGMFMIALYGFKYYLMQQNSSKKTSKSAEHNSIEAEVDMTHIIRSDDLDLTKTKIKEISPRFSKKKKKKIPALKIWQMKQFWTDEIAQNISNQLYANLWMKNNAMNHFIFP